MKKIEKVDILFNNFVREIYPNFLNFKEDIIAIDAFLKREHSIDINCLGGSLFNKYDNDSYTLKLLNQLNLNKNENLNNQLKAYYTSVNKLKSDEILELRSLLILYLYECIDYKLYKNLFDSLDICESDEALLINRLFINYNFVKEDGKKSSNKVLQNLLKDEVLVKSTFYNKLCLNNTSLKKYVKYYIELCEDLDKKHLSSNCVLYYIRKCHRYYL